MAASVITCNTNPSLSSPFLLLCLSLLLLTINPTQGSKILWQERYPFIRPASTFSMQSSTSSNGGKKPYDYIVVGGGTAGCPLAATLSRNYSVLLLERGGVPFNYVNVTDAVENRTWLRFAFTNYASSPSGHGSGLRVIPTRLIHETDIAVLMGDQLNG